MTQLDIIFISSVILKFRIKIIYFQNKILKRGNNKFPKYLINIL